MAKAFNEDEKQEIKQKMMDIALMLFHESGTKGLSIKELTSRTGIAQGSFYNFWKDKDALILDVMQYRSAQKLAVVEKYFKKSLDNPVGFLADIIYEYSVDFKEKCEKKPIYAEALAMLARKNEGKTHEISEIYTAFIKKIAAYWREKGAVKSIDERGLLNAFIGSFVLFSNYSKFEKEYFNEVLRTFITAMVERYIEVR